MEDIVGDTGTAPQTPRVRGARGGGNRGKRLFTAFVCVLTVSRMTAIL
jgi:hypothetical protein